VELRPGDVGRAVEEMRAAGVKVIGSGEVGAQYAMTLEVESYARQVERWPKVGKHILAQFDDRSVVVYQAYRAEIGRFAIEHQRFGGGFSFNRMTWVKPNFLWMMYRSGWGSKQDQQVVLAVRLQRAGFEELLRQAVHSNFVAEVYGERAVWEDAVANSNVRLQWDPDHGPGGEPLERRAIQLGIRGKALSSYAQEWVLSIEDVSEFVQEQAARARSNGKVELLTPREEVYPVVESETARKLGVICE
jgi:hypothetical protein